eukprot:scaffold142446_cov32-Tisochrysis_lutea.AAC.1
MVTTHESARADSQDESSLSLEHSEDRPCIARTTTKVTFSVERGRDCPRFSYVFRLQSGTIHPRRRRAHRYRVDLDRAKIASHATAGADPRRTTACTGPTLSTWVA